METFGLIKKIMKYPAECLLKTSEAVKDFDNGLLQLALDLSKTMQNVEWGKPVGLAAPQIGINKQVFIAQDKIYVNPKITGMSKSISFEKEGCYSLEENKSYQVERPQSVWVEYQDLDGNYYKDKLNGFKARVFCHEYDHLCGKLCAN